MAEIERKVLERSLDGDYQFTEYGDFLSYYHTHLQLFNKIITDNPGIANSQKKDTFEKIKGFMKEHIKKSDHFFEKSPEFASFLGITQNELTSFMNRHFLTALQKVQSKLKEQELEKLAHSNNFASIMEEILVKSNFVFPKDCRFIDKDGLIVIENILTGELLKPQGMLSAIKAEQEKEHQKKQELLQTLKKNREKNQDVFYEETPILQEIVDKFGEITPIPLELKSDIQEIVVPETIIPQNNKPKGLLDDVPDLDMSFDSSPQMEGLEDEEMEGTPEPGLLDDIGALDSRPSYQAPPEDDLDFLDAVVGSVPPKEEPDNSFNREPEEKPTPLPDIADTFNYKQYSEINKIVQNYKAKNDTNGYNNWMKNASSLEKCFISIKTNLAKEANGTTMNWDAYYDSVASKTELSKEIIAKLKDKIVHLDKTKNFLDICIKQLKTQPNEVLSVLKTGWPHIVEAFGDAPDYDSVSAKLQDLLTRIKSPSQREPIEKILYQAISKLKTFL
jgi:hypothetical protein